MEATTQEQSRRAALLQARMRGAPISQEDQTPDAAEPPKRSEQKKALKLATTQIVRALWYSAVPSFGTSLLLLGLYTLIKDLVFGRAAAAPIADPSEAFVPKIVAASMPQRESARGWLWFGSRLLIYPTAFLILCLLIAPIIILMILL